MAEKPPRPAGCTRLVSYLIRGYWCSFVVHNQRSRPNAGSRLIGLLAWRTPRGRPGSVLTALNLFWCRLVPQQTRSDGALVPAEKAHGPDDWGLAVEGEP